MTRPEIQNIIDMTRLFMVNIGLDPDSVKNYEFKKMVANAALEKCRLSIDSDATPR